MAKLELYKPNKGPSTVNSGHEIDLKRCRVGVWSNERWSRYSQCSKPGKYDAVIGGEQVKVCAIHRPEKVAEREAKSRAKYDQESRRWALGIYGPTFMAALIKIRDGDNNPRETAAAALKGCKYADEPR